jgi:protein-S-isoprenylcysteine O-methyltransferase Ste14
MPAEGGQRRGLLIGMSAINLALWAWLGALGWGGWRALLADPARAGCVWAAAFFTLVALASPVNLSSGVREDRENRWIFAPSVAGLLALTFFMPYMDRRDLWTIDGETARWVGLVLFLAGCVLRVWPIFILGRRFSGLVAIQPGHQLVTHGPYRYVRHPSYAGMMLGFVGWALVFRSSIGVVAAALGLLVLLSRIEAEESLLLSQFGSPYEDYRRRTWRLVPWVY